ncbi:RxLR effector protein [Phytophthora megakarya]|uniref:RxLR effector protein n=1 Tax=Phytophthora megakarya TaxID=4795 RepID=A0A225W4R5_9STRA|nr:RxLR effector protein [Phytophthora megakarya]
MVNGELSEPSSIESGIRQGCPLAPLLFILAAEILGLALAHASDIAGIKVPGDIEQREHLFSAFVDDSTVFLQKAKQLPRVLTVVQRFGELSGLRVQPSKSVFISLNTAVAYRKEIRSIPVLRHGETTRYLGYQVGTAELRDVNWADRLRKIQRRLATACRVATSIEDRVAILNAIVLPAVTFTSAAFQLPKWAEKKLQCLQKNFLWQAHVETSGGKHKINPGLVFLPKKVGGIGLVSIPLAVKTQQAKHALLWLIQKPDVYLEAWKFWVLKAPGKPASPRKPNAKNKKIEPGMQLISEWIQPTDDEAKQREKIVENHYEDILEFCTSWWDTDGRFVIQLNLEVELPRLAWQGHIETFWGTFGWSDDP